MAGDDDFVLGEAGEVRDADVQIGIAACDARRSGVRHRRRASGADHAPLGSRQLGQSLADGRHQLVELDVLLVRRHLGSADFGQLHRAADDRQRAATVDQRPDANGVVKVRIDGQRGRHGRCRGSRCGRRQDPAGAEDSRQPEQLSPVEATREARSRSLCGARHSCLHSAVRICRRVLSQLGSCCNSQKVSRPD